MDLTVGQELTITVSFKLDELYKWFADTTATPFLSRKFEAAVLLLEQHSKTTSRNPNFEIIMLFKIIVVVSFVFISRSPFPSRETEVMSCQFISLDLLELLLFLLRFSSVEHRH